MVELVGVADVFARAPELLVDDVVVVVVVAVVVVIGVVGAVVVLVVVVAVVLVVVVAASVGALEALPAAPLPPDRTGRLPFEACVELDLETLSVPCRCCI